MRRAPLIAAAVSVLLAVALVFLLVMPKMKDVDEANERLQEAEEQELVLQTELSRLQASAEEAPALRRELKEFRQAVPAAADLPGLINLLQDAADRAGVDFFSIVPGAPAPAAGRSASEIPAQIQTIGGFFSVREFMFRLETLQRASKVVSITVAPGEEDPSQLDVNLEARFYTTDLTTGPGAAGDEAPQPGETITPAPGTSPATGASPEPTGTEAALPPNPGA
ncbi:MAG: type 4a pilus biogenesis protein PilO [Actinomycetota bacterium]